MRKVSTPFILAMMLFPTLLDAQKMPMNGQYNGASQSATDTNSTLPAVTGSAKPLSGRTILYVNEFSGSTADVKFANACAALPETGGTLDARSFGASTQTIAATVSCGSATRPVTILFDPATTYVPSAQDVDMFSVPSNCTLDGLSASATLVPGYSGNMVKFIGICGDGMRCYLRNFTLTNGTGTSNPGTGTGVLLQATNVANYLAYVDIEHGRIEGFQYGMYLRSAGKVSSPYFVNDTRVNDVTIKNAVACIVLKSDPGDVIGNLFLNSSCQYGPQSATGLTISGVSGSNTYGNQFMNFNIWDYTAATIINFDPNSSRNYYFGTAPGGGKVTDNGVNNNEIFLDTNAFANPWPTLKTSGDFQIVAPNGHGLFLKTSDTQWNIQPHTQVTGDLGFTLSGTGTPFRLTTGGAVGSNIPIPISFTTKSTTSENLVVTGMTSRGHCSLTATNAAAAAMMADTYVSAKTTNEITIKHTASRGAAFDILCTPN
ncbi:MAG TPA: hypothetical protein VMU53_06055 [Candidatus Sulfotelmatobacter sp.]|nr:hypothetical protein [Candidatus Sulfotelmatobacter sp.]